MSLFVRQIGRILFLAFFFFTAIKIIEDPSKEVAKLNKYYPKFYNWYNKDLGLENYVQHLEPHWIKADFIK